MRHGAASPDSGALQALVDGKKRAVACLKTACQCQVRGSSACTCARRRLARSCSLPAGSGILLYVRRVPSTTLASAARIWHLYARQ
jgi:hypothetical protein